MGKTGIYTIGGRSFSLTAGTQAVDEHLINAIKEIIEDMPESVQTEFKNMDLKKLNPITSLLSVSLATSEFLINNMHKLLACMILEIGKSEQDRDINEYREFIRLNAGFTNRMSILIDFFTNQDVISQRLVLEEMFPMLKTLIGMLISTRSKGG